MGEKKRKKLIEIVARALCVAVDEDPDELQPGMYTLDDRDDVMDDDNTTCDEDRGPGDKWTKNWRYRRETARIVVNALEKAGHISAASIRSRTEE